MNRFFAVLSNDQRLPVACWLRHLSAALVVASLLSCGGGGGGGGGAPIAAGGTAADGGSTLGVAAPPPRGSGAGDGAAGGGEGAGSSGSAGSAAGGSASASAGGSTGGSGAGSDGGGVGSGGTGVASAKSTAIGSIDGFGSVIVNGVRYDTSAARIEVEDGRALQFGMSVRVRGEVDPTFTTGVAAEVVSAPEFRGLVTAVDRVGRSLTVLGTVISLDDETVFGDSAGFGGIQPGSYVQVWGLPDAPGQLRATRVETASLLALPIVTGIVRNFDPSSLRFDLGGLSISLAGDPASVGAVTNGSLVRVRASTSSILGVLTAATVQAWYPLPPLDRVPLQIGGVVTDFNASGSLRVLGILVDTRPAQVSGGPARSLGNGVKVDIAGTLSNGVLEATRIRLRQIPGTGGPVRFTAQGTITNFDSIASFRVQGQTIDASASTFVNGSASDLARGARVSVQGSRVVGAVLVADVVSFDGR